MMNTREETSDSNSSSRSTPFYSSSQRCRIHSNQKVNSNTDSESYQEKIQSQSTCFIQVSKSGTMPPLGEANIGMEPDDYLHVQQSSRYNKRIYSFMRCSPIDRRNGIIARQEKPFEYLEIPGVSNINDRRIWSTGTRLTNMDEKLEALERGFSSNPYYDRRRITELANELGLTEMDIEAWVSMKISTTHNTWI